MSMYVERAKRSDTSERSEARLPAYHFITGFLRLSSKKT